MNIKINKEIKKIKSFVLYFALVRVSNGKIKVKIVRKNKIINIKLIGILLLFIKLHTVSRTKQVSQKEPENL